MSDVYLELTAYFGERQRTGKRFVAEAMLDLFAERQVATSVMLRGIASFGLSRIVRSDQSLTLSEDPPVAVAAVDTEAVITALLDDAVAMTTQGLLNGAGAAGDRPGIDTRCLTATPSTITVYVGRRHRVDGAPASTRWRPVCIATTFDGASALLGWTALRTASAAARTSSPATSTCR